MFGLNIDPNNPRGNPDPQELKALGVQMVRYTFYDSSGGDQIDPQKAQFYSGKAKAYKDVGIDSLVILTYDTYPNRPRPEGGDGEWDQYIERFARRAGQIAQLLAPVNPAFQVWNEPDHPVHPGYVPTLREAVFGRMLRRTYDTIKQVDRSFVVVTGGLASGNPGWLSTVIRSQGGNLPADAVAFHPYGQRPERNWPHPNWAFGFVGDLLNNYYQAGQHKPLWITEMGVKEEDLGNNREQVAEFVRRYYRTIVNNYGDKVQQLQWFCYSDGMVPTFGLTDAGGNPKPAYNAFRQVAAELRSKAAGARPASVPPAAQPAPQPPATAIPPMTPPQTVPAPTFTPPPLTTVPAPTPIPASNPQQVGQLSNRLNTIQTQVNQLQTQLSQLQQIIQQLVTQQAQLQQQIQQLGSQPAPQPQPVPSTPTLSSVAPPPIENITNQLPRHPSKQWPTRQISQIQRIIIHHTAIVPQVGAERIAEHRVQKQDWPGIGYHYFITGDGRAQQTNELTTVAKHAVKFNEDSIGICFAGDFTNVTPTPQQIETGARLIAWLLAQLRLPVEAVIGHKEFINTQSPGLQWDSGARWGDQLKARVRQLL